MCNIDQKIQVFVFVLVANASKYVEDKKNFRSWIV